MMTADGIVVRHEPKWAAPVILVACPNCGREAERTPGSWAANVNGLLTARMTCEPLGVEPKCWQTFDALCVSS